MVMEKNPNIGRKAGQGYLGCNWRAPGWQVSHPGGLGFTMAAPRLACRGWQQPGGAVHLPHLLDTHHWPSAAMATCECAGLLEAMGSGLYPAGQAVGGHGEEERQEENHVCLELWKCSRQVIYFRGARKVCVVESTGLNKITQREERVKKGSRKEFSVNCICEWHGANKWPL